MAKLECLAAVAALMGAIALSPTPGHADTVAVAETNLVSNLTGHAKTIDPNLRNPWGITSVPGGALWIADNNSGLSTLYNGLGDIIPLVVTVAWPAGTTMGSPTGIVWNPTTGFNVTESGTAVAALFIFDSEDGTISAWAPVNGTAPASTTIVVDNSQGGKGAVYKGLAFGINASGAFIFATNFRAGTVEAYDKTFKLTKLTGAFADPQIPAGFAPFGIQNIDGDLFVTYAKQDKAKHDDVPGDGLGYVDVFSTDGVLLHRFASQGPLNAPWAVVRAPFSFGPLAGQILVGNFGNGWINAFPITGGTSTGPLMTRRGTPVAIQGLWSVVTGTGTDTSPDTLYFTAGPTHEKNGLFGSLTPKVTAGAGW